MDSSYGLTVKLDLDTTDCVSALNDIVMKTLIAHREREVFNLNECKRAVERAEYDLQVARKGIRLYGKTVAEFDQAITERRAK